MNGGQKWKTYRAEGLKSSGQDFSELIMIDRSNFFLFGFEDRDADVASVEQMAIICKSTDGGKTWSTQRHDSGSAWTVYVGVNMIYACRVEHTTIGGYRTLVYTTSNLGATWDSLATIDGYVTFMQLDSLQNGAVIINTGKSEGYRTYKAKDGFRYLLELPLKNVYSPIVVNEDLIFFEKSKESNQSTNNTVCRYNLKSGITSHQALPAGLDGYKLYKEKELWILAYKDNAVCLYKETHNLTFDLVKCFSGKKRNYPHGIFVSHGQILVVVGQAEGMTTTYKVFSSNDNGVNWVEESIESPTNFMPYNFVFDKSTNKILGAANAFRGRITFRE